MDKEVYLVGVDEGNGTSVKPSVSLLKIGENGVLQCLDIFNLKIGLSKSEMQKEIDVVCEKYERLYNKELSSLNSGINKWYNKIDGRKIKVNNTLIEQLKQFQFR